MTLKYCNAEVQALDRLFYCMDWSRIKQEREFITPLVYLQQFQCTLLITCFKFTELKCRKKVGNILVIFCTKYKICTSHIA